MSWRIMLVALSLISFSSLQAQPNTPANGWKDFDFLVGEWTWVGGGKPGQGQGISTFQPELDGTVLVRKTHLDYPATKDRAAFGHDDLLYVYHDPQDNSLRAIFFDGEGSRHSIRDNCGVRRELRRVLERCSARRHKMPHDLCSSWRGFRNGNVRDCPTGQAERFRNLCGVHCKESPQMRTRFAVPPVAV